MEVMAAAVNHNTYTDNKSIASQVNAHLEAAGKSIALLAREISYSRTTVSRYLSGKYDSDSKDIEARLTEYLAKHSGEPIIFPTATAIKAVKRPRFFESRDAKSILGVCQSCQEYIGFGIVVGRSGFGKTYTLKEYAKLPRVAYIECDDTMSSRDLVEAIERSLGIPSSYGTIWKRVNAIREFCNTNKGYLIIIDEADKLISKFTQKKMEILRAIFDQSDVGILIAGEPKLEAQIKTYLARMANRVDFYVTLRGLAFSEVEGYLEGYEVDPDALAELKARACNTQTGCFRLLDRTLSNIFRILSETGDNRITIKIIEQASSMMML
jgi:DNA transposition AAA+ family ATPase